MLHTSQYSAVLSNTTFSAVARVRDAVTYALLTHAPLCVLSLDFIAAFDGISHIYLFLVLKIYGYCLKLLTLQQAPYDKTFSSVQINGYVAGHFPIRCYISQGCPISVLQFALVLNPLVCLFERHLTGIRIVQRVTKPAFVAHAEDVTIFETASADIQLIGDLLLTYERAKGVRLNIRKSKAMAASS